MKQQVGVDSGNDVVHHDAHAAVHVVEFARWIRFDNVENAKNEKCESGNE